MQMPNIQISKADAMLIWWGFSNVMSLMPQPPTNSNIFVLWMYNISQFIAANQHLIVKRPTQVTPAT